jgi:hypothetical protein
MSHPHIDRKKGAFVVAYRSRRSILYGLRYTLTVVVSCDHYSLLESKNGESRQDLMVCQSCAIDWDFEVQVPWCWDPVV